MARKKKKQQQDTMKIAGVFVLGFLLAGVIGWTLGIKSGSSHQIEADRGFKQFTSYDDCIANGGNFIGQQPGNACINGGDQLFLQYSAQNLPRLTESKKARKDNVVEKSVAASADLVSFLKHDETGCETGYYKIIKEVKNRFALLTYGCDKPDASMIAMKLSNGWTLISPTNHMRDGAPSCLLADMFRVSSKLVNKCFENTGYNDGTLRGIKHP